VLDLLKKSEDSNKNVLLGHYDWLKVRESFTFSDFYYSTPVEPVEEENRKKHADNEIENSYGENQKIYLVKLPEKSD